MKVQSFLPYDSSTLVNYKLWAQGIGNALSTLGWTKTADTGQVVWANVVVIPGIAPITNAWSAPTAWAGGTNYTGVGGGSAGAFSVVTSGGLTYACINNSQLVLASALQNAAVTLGTVTATANAAGGTTVYTVASGVLATQVGQQFVVTGMANPANNGTFMCTGTSGTTSITLSNPSGVLSSAQTGSASSSASVLSFLGTITGGTSNAYVGHSFITGGFVNGANNITATVTSSHLNAFAVTATGVSETKAATATENTAPASDTIHWTGYNYEVWQMTDASAATNPCFLRIVYTTTSGSPKGAQIYVAVGTGTTGNGFVSGVTFTNSGAEFTLPNSTTNVGQGSTLFECDFCVSVSGGSLSMMLFRDMVFFTTAVPSVLVLDRAHDNFGSDIDAYVVCLMAGSSIAREQILYKPGTGGTKIPNSAAPFSSWSIPNFNLLNTGMAVNNNAPALPIFPVGLGYLASPCLGAFVMKPTDSVEGSLIPLFMYGAVHTFLMGKGNYSTVDQGSGSTAVFVGIRFE